MDFKNLKETSCPICGCTIIESENIEIDTYGNSPKVRTHCNGQRWEHRTFACGQRVSWSPNGNHSELSKFYVCRMNPEYIERKRKREKAIELTVQYIEGLEVDQDFKNRLIFAIKVG